MPIELRCSGCGGLLKLPDEHLGRQVRCAACGAILTAAPTVPTLEESPLPSLDKQDDIVLRLSVLQSNIARNSQARLSGDRGMSTDRLELADSTQRFLFTRIQITGSLAIQSSPPPTSMATPRSSPTAPAAASACPWVLSPCSSPPATRP